MGKNRYQLHTGRPFKMPKRKRSRRRYKNGGTRGKARGRYVRGPYNRGGKNPRSGGKLVRLIKRIAQNQIETFPIYNAWHSYDNNPYGGWGTLANGYASEPCTPIVVTVNGTGMDLGTFRPKGDKVTLIGAKVFIKITDNYINRASNLHDMFRLFWMRGGEASVLSAQLLNAMVVQPNPLHGLVALTGFSYAAGAVNNMETRFLYKKDKKWIKRWDTGWTPMSVRNSANVSTSSIGGADQNEPLHMYKTKNLSRWLAINQEYEWQQNPGTLLYNLVGFVPQFICMLFTGPQSCSPDCDISVDLYFKDA